MTRQNKCLAPEILTTLGHNAPSGYIAPPLILLTPCFFSIETWHTACNKSDITRLEYSTLLSSFISVHLMLCSAPSELTNRLLDVTSFVHLMGNQQGSPLFLSKFSQQSRAEYLSAWIFAYLGDISFSLNWYL